MLFTEDFMNKRIKKNFLRKILNACLKNKNYSTVVFHATFPLDDLKEFNNNKEIKKDCGSHSLYFKPKM